MCWHKKDMTLSCERNWVTWKKIWQDSPWWMNLPNVLSFNVDIIMWKIFWKKTVSFSSILYRIKTCNGLSLWKYPSYECWIQELIVFDRNKIYIFDIRLFFIITYLSQNFICTLTLYNLPFFFIVNQRLNQKIKLQMLLIYSFRILNVRILFA